MKFGKRGSMLRKIFHFKKKYRPGTRLNIFNVGYYSRISGRNLYKFKKHFI